MANTIGKGTISGVGKWPHAVKSNSTMNAPKSNAPYQKPVANPSVKKTVGKKGRAAC